LKICAEYVDDIPLLLFAEEFGFARRVRKKEERHDCDHDCECTLHKEDPWPSVVSTEFDLG